jgi:HEPN domain-containing protein
MDSRAESPAVSLTEQSTDVVNRETGFGFWNVAADYLKAAQSLALASSNHDLDLRFPYPILHLASHAIELFLKAMLRNTRGVGSNIHGHDLERLLDQAQQCGLAIRVSPDETTALSCLNAWYGRSPYVGRYHVTGSDRGPDLEALLGFSERLQLATREWVSPDDWKRGK